MGRRRAPLAVLPVVVAVIELVGSTVAARHQGVGLPAGSIVLLLAGPALLFLRRRAPGPAVAAITLVDGAYLLAGYPWGPALLSLALGLVFSVLGRARWWGWASVAVLAAGFAVAGLVPGWAPGPGQAAGQGRWLAMPAWFAVILLVTELVRSRRDRASEQRRIAREQIAHRRDEERLVLARDIHDVVAHSLSMINVQSSVALHLGRRNPDPEALLQALATIKAGSASALAEVREVLAVLRQDAPRVPGQRLDALAELIDRVRSAGLEVGYTAPARPWPAWVGERTENVLYRAVQESLTNVVRHAQATSVDIEVSLQEAGARLRVADDGRGRGGNGEGNGLRGLRERVAALGGTVSIEDADADGTGTIITVTLPAQEAP
ncbi:sensor histidine kinase [Arthrobacter sp.]|uniref:sensor histidine kinase n=1 Tax=Arthrobacter sp. TaxID=1667 RepID=UPI003A8DEFA0